MSVFLSAAIIESPDPGRLAEFYREILEIPLELDTHTEGETPHYECEIGDVHFAIFRSVERKSGMEAGRIRLAFAVRSLEEVLQRLKARNIELLYAPIQRGFAKITGLNDPDGNFLELTELSAKWLDHLEKRSPDERDVVYAAKFKWV